MPNLKEVIKLTKAQMETLQSGGSIGGHKLSEDTLYMVEREDGGEVKIPQATTSSLGGIIVDGIRDSSISTTQGGTTSGRYYGVELDSTGKAFVNVPWTAAPSQATTTTLGTIKVASTRSSSPSLTTGETTTGRYYGVELDSSGKAFVNVPWEAYSIATSSVAGLVKPYSVITKPSINSVSTTSGKYYHVQMSSDGAMFVNVPWTDNNTTYGNASATAGLVRFTSGSISSWTSSSSSTDTKYGKYYKDISIGSGSLISVRLVDSSYAEVIADNRRVSTASAGASSSSTGSYLRIYSDTQITVNYYILYL